MIVFIRFKPRIQSFALFRLLPLLNRTDQQIPDIKNSFCLRSAQQHTTAMVGLVSAAGLVGFLSEPDPELRSFALKQLDSQVDLLWTEIANSVGEMYVTSRA